MTFSLTGSIGADLNGLHGTNSTQWMKGRWKDARRIPWKRLINRCLTSFPCRALLYARSGTSSSTAKCNFYLLGG